MRNEILRKLSDKTGVNTDFQSQTPIGDSFEDLL